MSFKIYNNQKNAPYSSGLCTERTVLLVSGYLILSKKLTMLAVTARQANSTEYQAAWPCGGCHQVITEYEN